MFKCQKFEQELDITNSVKTEAIQYTENNNLNTDYAIFIDMSIHSGLNRFYLYNFQTNEIELSCLVSHGCCSNPWGQDHSKVNPIFSNVRESHCSSLGKYRLSIKSSYSNWGINIKYLLYGLDDSNSNALDRTIVLHSWEKIDDVEVYPNGTPEGWGCPAISNNNMRQLHNILKQQSDPVLMWIYQSKSK